MKLQKIFGQLGYVEQTGHGVPLIISNYGKQAFDIMDNFVNVTIPFHYEKQVGTDDNGWRKEALSEAEERVVEALWSNPQLTIRELVNITGYSDGYVRKILTALKGKGVLERQGGKKKGIWIIR